MLAFYRIQSTESSQAKKKIEEGKGTEEGTRKRDG
jgi:hypothetical protein